MIVSDLFTFLTTYSLLIDILLVMKLDCPALTKYQSAVIGSDLVTFITTYPRLIEILLVIKLDVPALTAYRSAVIVPDLVTSITAYPLLIEILLVMETWRSCAGQLTKCCDCIRLVYIPHILLAADRHPPGDEA